MTKEEAQETLAILSASFSVPVPKLRFFRARNSGRYFPSKKQINCGPHEWVLLHEFAHHVDYCRRAKRYPHLRSSHDQPFRYLLVHIAEAWYGSADKYPWKSEYKAIQNWRAATFAAADGGF